MSKTLGDIGDKVDLKMKQGKTFGPHVGQMLGPDGTPVDLTGCTLRAQIRRTPSHSTAIDFDVEITDAEEGTFSLGLTAAVATGLTLPVYVWDLEYVDAQGRELPVCYGDVNVALEVTRA